MRLSFMRCSLPEIVFVETGFFPMTLGPMTLGLMILGVAQAQPVDVAEEARLGRDKLAAEIAAVDAQTLRASLLKSADNDRLAQWYAGKVRVDGQWLTLEAIEKKSAQDNTLSAYRDLRQKAMNNLATHERLARWCQKKQLTDLAHMHWMYVLRMNPQHKAALNELELRWHNGVLLSVEEFEQSKQREREWQKEKRTWQAKIRRLQRDIEKGQLKVQAAARQELHAIDQPAAVPALIEEFAKPANSQEQTVARRTELMMVLGDIDSPVAIETLAQFAVESPEESIRYAAIDQLKSKPLEAYIPALLAGLAMPVEASVRFNDCGSRIVGSYSFSQEKPGGKQYTENRNTYQDVPGQRYRATAMYTKGDYIPKRTIKGSTYQVPKNPGHGLGLTRLQYQAVCNDGKLHTLNNTRRVYGSQYLKKVKTEDRTVGGYHEMNFAGFSYSEDPNFVKRQQATRQSMKQQARRTEQQVEAHNAATRIQNERIAGVLSEVTGETLSVYPQSWWNWWSNFLDEHPDVANAGTRRQLNADLASRIPRGLARGTWIWTRRGKRPIESLLPGDYVLSQDPRTGELNYQVLLAISRSPQQQVTRIELHPTGTDASELYCVPGHAVWSAGTAWQRVSKLEAGQALHGAKSTAHVAQVDSAFEIDSYDLIVEGFHTFFAGSHGVLVHDATPIVPAYVALPGFSPAAVADAVQLADQR